LAVYCDLVLEVFKRTKSFQVYDDAMDELRAAEERLGDPDIARLIGIYERRRLGQAISSVEQIEDPELLDNALDPEDAASP